MRSAAHEIRHFKAKPLILDVGANLGMRLGDAAEFRLPIAVADDPS